MTKNELAKKHLIGHGLELGALHNPVDFDADKATVLYADRLLKADAIAAFPELEDMAKDIVETDLVIDIDTDSLEIIKEKNFDFVIANHVIEHLVNPISFLKRISDNLKANGRLFLTVPNMEFTHDSNRRLTRYKTLLLKYYLGTQKLSNSRIRDYLKNKHEVSEVNPHTQKYFEDNGLPLSYYKGNRIPINPIQRKKLYEYHRSRSIHVHVWNRATFDFFLRRTIDKFNLGLEITHYLPAEASHGEMIYLLKKSTNYQG